MQILKNEPLKNYVNYKIGGPTPTMYIVKEKTDFDKIPDEDLRNAYVLGEGTNILVGDNGPGRSVIKMEIEFLSINPMTSTTIMAGAGIRVNKLAKSLAETGWDALINVSGIPGTIGGQVIMNAGASHGTISDNIINVEAYNKETRQSRLFKKEECGFGFRTSIFQNSPWIITFVAFKTEHKDPQELLKLYQEINQYRRKNYPLTFPSAGCWFKGDWGGKEIIKEIGMSGAINGGAVASPMFPAFILNTGEATAKDVYSLVRDIQEKAKIINKELPLEVDVWGEI